MDNLDRTVFLQALAASNDPDIKMKAGTLPMIIAEWAGSLDGKRILDFGSGYGYTAWGLAMSQNPAYVAGVDINNEFLAGREVIRNKTELDWPANLKLAEIKPGQKLTEGNFDLIYSWSVFEHVHLEILDEILQDLRGALAPNGRLFIQIAPLFHSREGGHLWELGYNNWEHLLMQKYDLEKAIRHSDRLPKHRREPLWSMFSTLNRLTADGLKRILLRNGFLIERIQQDAFDGHIPEMLNECYQEAALRTYQIVLLLRRS